MYRNRTLTILLLVAFLGAACSSDGTEVSTATGADTETAEATASDETDEATAPEEESSDTTTESVEETPAADESSDSAEEAAEDVAAESEPASSEVYSFQIEVWADNWMGVYVDGVLIGEDSVSITTERSFNSETFTFEASLPFTLAIEAKDYIETNSGLEYIGESNQQIGDGGIIAQVTNLTEGGVVAVTDGDWVSLVVHRAPLNTDCASDADPDSTCEYEISETPADWASTSFDDSAWSAASVWTADDVDPKIGYDDITWDASAQLIWGTDLEVDNIVLLRTTVGAEAASGSSYGG